MTRFSDNQEIADAQVREERIYNELDGIMDDTLADANAILVLPEVASKYELEDLFHERYANLYPDDDLEQMMRDSNDIRKSIEWMIESIVDDVRQEGFYIVDRMGQTVLVMEELDYLPTDSRQSLALYLEQHDFHTLPFYLQFTDLDELKDNERDVIDYPDELVDPAGEEYLESMQASVGDARVDSQEAKVLYQKHTMRLNYGSELFYMLTDQRFTQHAERINQGLV